MAGINWREVLSILIENIDEFRRRLNKNCTLSEDELYEKISIDMQLPLAYVSETLIGELECLEPFGKANPKPVFAEKDIQVRETRILGKNQNVLKLQLSDMYGTTMEGMYFGDIEEFMETVEKKNGRMNITYYPSVNEYKGEKRCRLSYRIINSILELWWRSDIIIYIFCRNLEAVGMKPIEDYIRSIPDFRKRKCSRYAECSGGCRGTAFRH